MSKGRKNRKRKVTSSNSITNDSKPNEKKQRSSNKTGNDDDNSDKIMREHEEQHDDLTELDCIPTRCVLKEQIETGMRARCFVLVEVSFACFLRVFRLSISGRKDRSWTFYRNQKIFL
ncbi:unnamed protein product [Anisakis simplex]|uniref:Uncharacterized protein n=1 Tax=Anisakis simplex TaxID=6269 RepID=A0A0M3JPB0_ANISI|nr:unnamed protein product [Anisakis simplex]VDK37910.1 unnamed protein product [Anisakis simplex]